MKKETKDRIAVIKDYLQKWDWGLAPLFMVSEKDAKAIMELIEDREAKAMKRKARYMRDGRKTNDTI